MRRLIIGGRRMIRGRCGIRGEGLKAEVGAALRPDGAERGRRLVAAFRLRQGYGETRKPLPQFRSASELAAYGEGDASAVAAMALRRRVGCGLKMIAGESA